MSPGIADKLWNTDSWFICSETGNRNAFPDSISESNCLSSSLRQGEQLVDYNEQQGNLLLLRSAFIWKKVKEITVFRSQIENRTSKQLKITLTSKASSPNLNCWLWLEYIKKLSLKDLGLVKWDLSQRKAV